MKKTYFLICYVVFLFSCDEVEEDSDYYIAGRVVNSVGEGVEGVKIYYSNSDYVITDRSGNWSVFDIYEDMVTITPVDSEYIFTPEKYQVNYLENGVGKIFTAETVESDKTTQIYNWLINQQLSNGLLESTENGNIVSLYDNALAAMVFMLEGDYAKAEKIFDFFNSKIDSELLNGRGGFSQLRDKNGITYNRRWMGDNAWLLIALNNYHDRTGNSKYDHLSNEIGKWLIGLQDEDGGLFGGYNPDDTTIHKITEGNIDAFNAIRGYSTFHDKLLNYLRNERWSTTDNNLVAWVENPTYLYALDLHSWSYCIFEDYPIGSLQSADRFLNTQISTVAGQEVVGYGFDEDKDVVWLEGTGHMALAFTKAGMKEEADFYLNEIEKVFIESEKFENSLGIPYSVNEGTSYGPDSLWDGASTKPAISSAAWYIFAKKGFSPFEIERDKGIPYSKKFWLHSQESI